MITVIYLLLQEVEFADVLLTGGILCMMLYIAICLAQKCNRSKKGARNALLFAIVSMVICDAIWLLVYFPKGDYVNLGLAGGVWLLIMPFLLVISGFAVSKVNSRKK